MWDSLTVVAGRGTFGLFNKGDSEMNWKHWKLIALLGLVVLIAVLVRVVPSYAKGIAQAAESTQLFEDGTISEVAVDGIILEPDYDDDDDDDEEDDEEDDDEDDEEEEEDEEKYSEAESSNKYKAQVYSACVG